MKYTNADLTRWLRTANAALAENDLECVATSFEGRGEIRSPKGGIVTVWASGKVSAGGPWESRRDLLSVLAAADLVVGFVTSVQMGGMLLKMPAAEVSEERIGSTSGRLLSASPIIKPAQTLSRTAADERSDALTFIDAEARKFERTALRWDEVNPIDLARDGARASVLRDLHARIARGDHQGKAS